MLDQNSQNKIGLWSQSAELLSVLDNSITNSDLKKLVNRDNLAESLMKLRQNTSFSDITMIEIQAGKQIDIRKNSHYQDFKKHYENTIDSKILQDLDTQFAELLILDAVNMDSATQSSLWIQINNDELHQNTKSKEELSAEAKRCLAWLKNLGYSDLEYVVLVSQKNDWSKLQELLEEIKYIQKKIHPLKSELEWKLFNEINRQSKKEELNQLEIRLEKLKSNYDHLAKLLNKRIFTEEFLEKTEYSIRNLKEAEKIAKDWMLSPIQKARLIAKESLLSEDMTLEKLQNLVGQLWDKYNLTVVEQERLIIYKEALRNIEKEEEKIYHVIRKKQRELPPHTPVIDEPVIEPRKKQKELPPRPPMKELPPHIPKPDPNPIPPTKKKERTATISNVENVHLEDANYKAEELARLDYEALGKLKLFDTKSRKFWKRLQTYLLRSVRRKKRRNADLASVKWKVDLLREDVVLASDRHEMESEDGNRLGWISRRLVNHHNPNIDILCKNFLLTNMDERDFEREFNKILRLDSTVTSIVGSGNMDYLASNILLKLKNEKDTYKLLNDVDGLLSTYNPTTFRSELDRVTNEYFNKTQKNYPDFITKIIDQINDPLEITRIVNHQKWVFKEDVKTLQMQLQLLDNTTGAYEIDNRDKEKWFWYKFGALMDKYPYLTIWSSVLAGAGILTLWWAIWWVVWAATATGLLATKIGMTTAAKKASHYTKEQKWQEKRLTHGLNAEQDAMKNIRDAVSSAPWWTWRRHKAKRQRNLYQNSTQRNIADTVDLTNSINRFVRISENLDATEEAALYNNLVSWLARVDYYKEIWHNFVASQDRNKVEQDMRGLYNSIVQWLEKFNRTPGRTPMSMGDLRLTSDYTTLTGDLATDYSRSMANFRTQRRRLELKYGIWSGLIYGWTAIWIQYLFGSGIFGNHPIEWTQTIFVWTRQELALHDEVKQALMDSGATSDNIQNIETALRNAPASASAGGYNQQARWTIVKNEMWWQDSQLNSWMHKFMENTVWTLNEWWASELKQQLLNAKIDSLSANSSAARTADAFLSSPKIALIEQWEWTTVLNNIKAWMSWKDIASFTADEKMKMWYYSHLFIGNDSWTGSRLTEMLTKMQEIGGTAVDVPGEVINRHFWLDGVGMPVFANTFMERVKPKPGDATPIELPDQPKVWDPTIVITDKNHPARTPGDPSFSRLQ